jgi:hypothetical protein
MDRQPRQLAGVGLQSTRTSYRSLGRSKTPVRTSSLSSRHSVDLDCVTSANVSWLSRDEQFSMLVNSTKSFLVDRSKSQLRPQTAAPLGSIGRRASYASRLPCDHEIRSVTAALETYRHKLSSSRPANHEKVSSRRLALEDRVRELTQQVKEADQKLVKVRQENRALQWELSFNT